MFHFGQNPEPTGQASALVRMVHMLLHELSKNPIRGEPEEYDRFCSSLTGIEAQLGAHPDAEQILILAGSAAKSIEDYHHHTSRYLAEKRASLVTLFAGALPEAAPQLRRLAARDFTLRELAECLSAIKAAPHPAPSHEARRMDAVAAIAGAQRIGNCFAAAIAVGRIPLITARWGLPLADAAMEAYIAEVRRTLPSADHLFRWSPGSLLLLLSRQVPLVVVRAELDRILPRRFERSFESGGHSVMLTIEAASSLWRLDSSESCETAIQRIEAFLGLHLAASG